MRTDETTPPTDPQPELREVIVQTLLDLAGTRAIKRGWADAILAALHDAGLEIRERGGVTISREDALIITHALSVYLDGDHPDHWVSNVEHVLEHMRDARLTAATSGTGNDDPAIPHDTKDGYRI